MWPLRKAMSFWHHQARKRQARMDRPQMRFLFRLPAPLPEIRHPVWRKDKETRTVLQSEGEIKSAIQIVFKQVLAAVSKAAANLKD